MSDATKVLTPQEASYFIEWLLHEHGELVARVEALEAEKRNANS